MGGIKNAGIGVNEAAAALPESLYTVRWSADEQKLLDDSLAATDSTWTPLEKYIAVAALLPSKGVRDVALRVRWMNRKDVSKRRRTDDGSARRGKDVARRDAGDSGWLASGPLFTGVVGLEHGANSGGVGNVPPVLVRMNDLLSHNLNIIQEIRENVSYQRIHDNREMLIVLHDNLHQLLLMMNKPTVMNQMPPIPTRLDNDLAAAVLHNAPSELHDTSASLIMPNSAMDSNTLVMVKDSPLVLPSKKETIGDGGMGIGFETVLPQVEDPRNAARSVRS